MTVLTTHGDDQMTVTAIPSGQQESADPFSLPCQLADPRLFFAESPKDVAVAKALCMDCPVRGACLAGATERQEPWGVWGGEVFVDGVVVAHKRGRGRPRKSAPLDQITRAQAVPAGQSAA